MNSKQSEEFDVLYSKIDAKLDSDNIVDTENEISARTLCKALNYGMVEYNNCFVNNQKRLVKTVNKKIFKNNILRNNLPYIYRLCPGVNEGKSYIVIYFTNNIQNSLRGKAIISEDLNVSFDSLSNEYDEEYVAKFLRNYNSIYSSYFAMLNDFKETYPGEAYQWNCDSPLGKAMIDDGFNTVSFSLDNVENPVVSFSQLRDCSVARTWCKKYGELYDYIDFFKFTIMKKIKVNINEDLNPLYQAIVRKQLELNDNFENY